jgi:two-component system phosphate regulon response regulator PhoB
LNALLKRAADDIANRKTDMSHRKILVVEDDPSIQQLLKSHLEKQDWDVQIAETGEAALLAVSDFNPELVLLDVMLPGLDGIEVCNQLRSYPKTRAMPIIMLSARSQAEDVVAGLRQGADDYITKPFSFSELDARIDTVMRRSSGTAIGTEPEPVHIHNLKIDPLRYTVEVSGKRAVLTHNDFRALLLLARQPGRVFSRRDIIEYVHGPHTSISERSVDVQIVGLRRKIDPQGQLIETVRGVGYRMKEE